MNGSLTADFDFTVTGIHFIVERAPDPRWSVRYANANYHILVFATGGKSHYEVQGQRYVVEKGDLLLFPKHMWHEGISDEVDPWSFYSVLFDLQFADSSGEADFNRLSPVVKSTNPFEVSALFQEFYRTWSTKSHGYLIKCRGLLMQLLYVLIRENSRSAVNNPHYYTIDKLLHVLAEDYHRHFTVQQLAELAGFSPSYLRQLFKQVTGVTINQYQQHIKISKARDLLLSGECNVTEASQRVGFNDIYYFSKLFKRMTGVTPSEYSNR